MHKLDYAKRDQAEENGWVGGKCNVGKADLLPYEQVITKLQKDDIWTYFQLHVLETSSFLVTSKTDRERFCTTGTNSKLG